MDEELGYLRQLGLLIGCYSVNVPHTPNVFAGNLMPTVMVVGDGKLESE